jgi:hypothetical protein
MSRIDIIRDLKERLRLMERSQRGAKETVLATEAASSWFFSRPLEWGTLIEWLGAGDGGGAATLALTVAASVLRTEGALVVIDSRREFYPPAAAALGVPLERCVIVRPGSSGDALWALEQSLRSGAAAVVLAWVGALRDAAFRRLQLAAETGGSLGFLLRPTGCRAEPSWAQMRLLVDAGGKVERASGSDGQDWHPDPRGNCWQVEVLHCRGGVGGEVVEVELSDEAGHVHLAARLGHSALPADEAGP